MTNRLPKNIKKLLKKELKIHFKMILSILYEDHKQEFHINKLFNNICREGKESGQTGLQYKKNTLSALDILEHAGIVDIIEKGKQKKIVNLTSTGRELRELISSTEKYNIAFVDLLEALHKKVFCISESILGLLDMDTTELKDKNIKEAVENAKFQLIEEGWKKDEIIHYNLYRTSLIEFKNTCDNNFFNILIYRYSLLIKSKNLIPNETILQIIKIMMLDGIEVKIDYLVQNYERVIRGNTSIMYDKAKLSNTVMIKNPDDIFQYFITIQDVFVKGVIPMILEKEVNNMLFQYFDLLKPDVRHLDIFVLQINDFIKNLKTNETPDRYEKIRLSTWKIFMDAYKKYCDK